MAGVISQINRINDELDSETSLISQISALLDEKGLPQGHTLTIITNNNGNVQNCYYCIDDGPETYFTTNMNLTVSDVHKIAFGGWTGSTNFYIDNLYLITPTGSKYDGITYGLIKDTIVTVNGSGPY